MTRRMIIDATHKEETRVAVVEENKLEEFDYETTIRKQLKGNIYLVKVTRVEPSLQAAFVDYGGNRHGFLPFSEIHPDYYRIPIEDRQALLEDESRIAKERVIEAEAKADAEAAEKDLKKKKKSADDADDIEAVETLDGDDIEVEVEEDAIRPSQLKTNIKRRYKIQEVIKRGQVMLIQINKEERGNKGAAVSSYMSLPGRYCVLMPNSARGGGVSRKVSNISDRKRLKKVLADIGVPEGMSVILRTAGVSRTKVEIKRDLDYLLRLWNDTRELTLKSTAPAIVHEEGNLIKRSIRDLYKKEIEEILIAGEDGYNVAKKFMKTLIPSHARRVKLDKEETPLFSRYKIEEQIDETYCPNVSLPSGGYLVINPTEALISIDINSGKATTGRHIEETAVKTNLEAAEEIARQLRLRDLGGLVVIDFIDMEENKNNRLVERKMRESMQGDRARIQISRISVFGLLELSRQRLRPSLVESNFMICPSCSGNGVVRTVESAAVMILRHIEEELIKINGDDLRVKVSNDVAFYLLNNKRHSIHELENKHKAKVVIEVSLSSSHQDFLLEKVNASGVAVKLYSSSDQINIDKKDSIIETENNNKSNHKNNNRNQKRRNNRNKRQHGEKKDNTSTEQTNNTKKVDKTEKTEKESVVKDIPIKESPTETVEVKSEAPATKEPTKEKKKPAAKRKPKAKKVEQSKPAKKEKQSETVVALEVTNNPPAEAKEATETVKPESKKSNENKKKGWWQKLKE